VTNLSGRICLRREAGSRMSLVWIDRLF
jgi:hypothetical protein